MLKRPLLWAEYRYNMGTVGVWGQWLDFLCYPSSLFYISWPRPFSFVGVCFSLISLSLLRGKYGWKNGMKLLFKVIMAKLPLAKWLAINLKHKWTEYQEAKKSVLEVRRKGIQVVCEILKGGVHWASVLCILIMSPRTWTLWGLQQALLSCAGSQVQS